MDEEHAAQRFREPFATLTGLVDCGDQLLGEERIAIGPARDRIDQRVRRCPAGDGGQQLDQLVALEPLEVDALDARLALRLGQPARQRMAAMQLVAAERPDDEQTFVARVAGKECEQVARRTIGPVQILDDE